MIATPPTTLAPTPLPVKFSDTALPCGIPSSNIGIEIEEVKPVNLLPSPTN